MHKSHKLFTSFPHHIGTIPDIKLHFQTMGVKYLLPTIVYKWVCGPCIEDKHMQSMVPQQEQGPTHNAQEMVIEYSYLVSGHINIW